MRFINVKRHLHLEDDASHNIVARWEGAETLKHGPHKILLCLQAKNILLAVGTKSIVPPIEGTEHTITSDGILDLKECPKK